MINRTAYTCFSVMLALATASYASAGTINTVGTMTEQSNSYTPDSNPGSMSSRVRVNASDPLGSFTHDFSALGETEWTVTWQAPAGKAIEIAVPVGFDDIEIEFQFLAGNLGIGSFGGTVPSSVVLALGSPALPLNNEQMGVTGPAGDSVSASADMGTDSVINPVVPGQTYRFVSVSLTLTVPANHDPVLDSVISDFFIHGRADFDGPGIAPADPGQWVSLVNVPEPGTVALLGLGLGGLAMIRRRRAN